MVTVRLHFFHRRVNEMNISLSPLWCRTAFARHHPYTQKPRDGQRHHAVFSYLAVDFRKPSQNDLRRLFGAGQMDFDTQSQLGIDAKRLTHLVIFAEHS